jgi:hypothetical protein
MTKSRFKKFCKERAGMAGVKVKRGSALDESSSSAQCPRCDRGLHRRCIRGSHCTARQRSPAGCSKRSMDRAAKREERCAQRAARRAGTEVAVRRAWRSVSGVWIARPVDGVCDVRVPVSAFGGKFPSRGEARFMEGMGGNAALVYALPEAEPPAGGTVCFRLQLPPSAVEGVSIVVAAGLEVRERVPVVRHLDLSMKV